MIEQAFKALELFPWHIPSEFLAEGTLPDKPLKTAADKASMRRALDEKNSALVDVLEAWLPRHIQVTKCLKTLQLQPELQPSLAGSLETFGGSLGGLMLVYGEAHDTFRQGDPGAVAQAMDDVHAAMEQTMEDEARLHLVLFRCLSLVCFAACHTILHTPLPCTFIGVPAWYGCSWC